MWKTYDHMSKAYGRLCKMASGSRPYFCDFITIRCWAWHEKDTERSVLMAADNEDPESLLLRSGPLAMPLHGFVE